MNIIFHLVEIHNFKSFGDATIQLDNSGYVLVKGENNNTADNAISNGAGKSSWSDAIVWALTGETSAGVSKNLVNIHTTDGMYVRLLFSVDNSNIEVIRSKDHKKYGTNLLITVNGIDKSGKGIRESDNILKNLLPDITSDIIGSAIILGQGLPRRFSNNTPSGRKEVLEKLSKSDFMIEDMKQRISDRKQELSEDLTEAQYKQTKLEIEKNHASQELQALQAQKTDADTIATKESELADKEKQCNDIKQSIDVTKNELTILNSAIAEANTKLAAIVNDKQKEIKDNNTTYNKILEALSDDFYARQKASSDELSNVNSKIMFLERDIKAKQSITDVCPTCGHKLEGVEIPDVTPLLDQLHYLKLNRDNIQHSLDAYKEEYRTNYDKKIVERQQKEDAIVEYYDKQIDELSNQETTERITQLNLSLRNQEKQYNDLYLSAQSLKLEIQTYYQQQKDIADRIDKLSKQLAKLDEDILYNTMQVEDIQKHIDIVNKMSTVVNRDFRGYLLSNVIDYINNKIQVYADDVFDGGKIHLSLSGNNIELTYDGRDISLLSGGERQKVDLVTQLAIRDMLCNCMNFSSNMIVIDEGFDALDALGCQKILDMFANKLKDVESIFIVSHHTDSLEIPCDKELIIVKDNNGISSIKE